MKKFMTIALCLAALGSASAQKANVDDAKKLSGKFDKIGEARSLIQQAMKDPSTANEANTYYVAGKIEFDAYDKGLQAGMINPQDPSADPVTMATELLNGYEYFMKALPLDSVPDEKGKVKPKVSKDIVGKLAGHTNDYFQGAASLYENKKYFPEAYNGFMIFADMPDQPFFQGKGPKVANEDRGRAYYYAGLAAWSGEKLNESAAAFRKSRDFGYDDEDATPFIYEIACWQNIAQRDSTQVQKADERIFEVAKAGYEKYGVSKPIFINNLVNTYVQKGDFNKAIETVNNLIASNPENASLYGLRGFIYDRQDNDDASIADYLKAASLPDCDFETLKNAVKKLYRVGSVRYGSLEPADRAGKMQLKADYFDKAVEIAQKAKAMKQDDSDLNYVIDSLEYAMQEYF